MRRPHKLPWCLQKTWGETLHQNLRLWISLYFFKMKIVPLLTWIHLFWGWEMGQILFKYLTHQNLEFVSWLLQNERGGFSVCFCLFFKSKKTHNKQFFFLYFIIIFCLLFLFFFATTHAHVFSLWLFFSFIVVLFLNQPILNSWLSRFLPLKI